MSKKLNVVPTKSAPMMKGSGGKHDYLLIASKGCIGLGLKPYIIAADENKGTTYVGARVRSSLIPVDDTPQNNVIDLNEMKLTLDTAWPKITWEKVDNVRASAPIGVFIKGSPRHNVSEFIAEFADKKMAIKMASYIISLVDRKDVRVTEGELVDWLDNIYKPVITDTINMQKVKDKADLELENNLGIFGVQTNQLKSMYSSMGVTEEEIMNSDPSDDIDKHMEDDEDKEEDE